jgi:hypothetical protein
LIPWKYRLSVVSTAGSAAFDPTPAPTLTSPDGVEALTAEEGLPVGEVLALADDRAVEAAEAPAVGLAGGWAVFFPFDRETSAYAPPPAASITSTTTRMKAALRPPEDRLPPDGGVGCAP